MREWDALDHFIDFIYEVIVVGYCECWLRNFAVLSFLHELDQTVVVAVTINFLLTFIVVEVCG